MTKNRETIAKLALLLGLLAILAGCGGGRGGDDEAGGTTAAAPGRDLSGRIEADGSSTVGPYTTAAAEDFQGAQPGVQVTVGVSGDRRRLRALLPRRDRPLERVASDQG